MSKTKQSANRVGDTVLLMSTKILIVAVERDGDDGLVVTFSDGTSAGYVTEELLELRPGREPVRAFFDLGRPAANVSA
jgi:hypothetical protein